MTTINQAEFQIEKVKPADLQDPAVKNISNSAKIFGGLLLSSSTLLITYAIHSNYQSWIATCNTSSVIECSRAGGALAGAISGVIFPCSLVLGLFLLDRITQSKTTQTSSTFPPIPQDKEYESKHSKIIQLAGLRRNIQPQGITDLILLAPDCALINHVISKSL